MAEVIKMPRLSDTMEEGNIVQWHKKVGDNIEPGDVLAEVETDKATMEIESYQEGVLLHIGIESGSVPVNSVIAVIGEEGEDWEKTIKAAQSSTPNGSSSEKSELQENKEEIVKEHVDGKEKTSTPSESKTPINSGEKRIKASPLAKAMAKDKGINLSQVSGSGDGGRIVKADLEDFTPITSTPQTALSSKFNSKGYTDEPLSQIRKTIARRLTESKFSAPHFYLTIEANVSKLVSFRSELNNNYSDGKISFNDIIIKAVATALKQHPDVNASWRGDAIRKYHDVNIGVAVAVDHGLVVPVLHHTDSMSLSEINTNVQDLAQKAADKKLTTEQMQGNTFTISNLGMFGIEEFTAIINPPDACILAVGAIQQKPVISESREILPAHLLKCTLSCDHRVVDGAIGARFLKTLKTYLENPLQIFL